MNRYLVKKTEKVKKNLISGESTKPVESEVSMYIYICISIYPPYSLLFSSLPMFKSNGIYPYMYIYIHPSP